MIIRAVHDKNNPYFQMRRATAQDRRLSAKARGVLAFLLSKPDGWEVRVDNLMDEFPDLGRDAVYAVLAELCRCGYAARKQRREGQGKLGAVETEIYEEPLTGLPEAAKPETVEPLPESPYTAGPYTARPYTANPEHINYRKKRVQKREKRERKEITEQQQQAANSNGIAAAAAQTELHNSLHDLADVRRYVEATKRHATNPGGLARKLWRSGEEDAEIARWLEAEAQASREREEARARSAEEDTSFDWDAWIEQCITSGWRAQLEIERAGIVERGGPRADWERRVIAYFNQHTEGGSNASASL